MRQRIQERCGEQTGFTMLELMAVVTILLILLALAATRYDYALVRAHESALHSDLDVINRAIQDYTRDKEKPPLSLDDPVQGPDQYLARIPNDPMTGAPDWTTENCDLQLTADQSSFGICSVHSSSNRTSPFDGSAYSSWQQ